jgi:osomolarity two-component system sensor histidine kinase TcsA
MERRDQRSLVTMTLQAQGSRGNDCMVLEVTRPTSQPLLLKSPSDPGSLGCCDSVLVRFSSFASASSEAPVSKCDMAGALPASPGPMPTSPISALALLDEHTPPRSNTSRNADSAEHQIFQFMPSPTLVLDASLVVVQVSDSFLTSSGVDSRLSLIGQPADKLFDQASLFSALTSARTAVQTVQNSALPTQIEHLTDSGHAWNVRANPIIYHGALRFITIEFQDVTKDYRKRMELEEQMYSNETFRILVETVKDYAIFMLDTDGNVASWNAGAQAFKGYTKSEIIGQHFSKFYSDEDRKTGKPELELQTALRDGRVEDEGWRYRKDGSRFFANVVITSLYKGDLLLGYSKVTRDLTDRREAEQQLIAAYEEASKLKSEFLANMSHEIRTPMHGLLSASTLLLDTRLDVDQLDLARIIHESGEILLQVINDILDYSKLANGSFTISRDVVSVSDIVQSVFRAHQRGFSSRVKLESYLDPLLPPSAEGDALRYRQIVQNLLSNATKFTEEGRVLVSAKLEMEDEESFTILTQVVDTGIGIPEGTAGALFTPFTQFDNSATKRYKGTGLGLSICKSLSELMDGQIGFSPNPEGRGSIFWFTAKLKKIKHLTTSELLRKEATKEVPYHVVVDPMEEIKHTAAEKRILLAEDNFINRKVMLRMLAGLGFSQVDVAIDGKEAVAKALRAVKGAGDGELPGKSKKTEPLLPYDLILMDINMPVQSGVSATQELRSKGVDVPIVAMTANALKGHAESYIAQGMTGYVAKPVDRKLLVKVLLKCLKPDGAG